MKKIIFVIILLLFFTLFILNPQLFLQSTKSGLELWYLNVLPTLLPFMIGGKILLDSQILKGKSHTKTIILICGLTFGFPIGAVLIQNAYKNHWLTKNESQSLLNCTGLFSPMFCINYIFNQMIHPILPIYILILLLYGIPVIYFLINNTKVARKSKSQKNTASRFNLDLQIIDADIINGFETLIKLCGYIVFFAIICSYIKYLPLSETIQSLIVGFLEITNGIFYLSIISLPNAFKNLFAICFFEFGGICSFVQLKSVIQMTNLSLKDYVIHKVYFALIAVFAYFILLQFPFQ